MNNYKAYLLRRFPDGESAGDEEWRIICPRCQHQDKKAFINLVTGKADCKHCTYFKSNGWWTTIMLVEGLGNVATAQAWFERQPAFTEYHYTGDSRSGEHRIPLVRALPKEYLPIEIDDHDNRYIRYIADRGFTRDQMVRFMMGWCEDGKYAGRIIIPVINEEGLEFFCDRLVEKDAVIKRDGLHKTIGIGGGAYYWPVKKKTVIFNYHRCRHRESVNVAEGVFSALSIHEDRTVALLGKECSGVQLIRLVNMAAKEFHLYLDPDAKAKTFSLAHRLTGYGRKVYIHWLNPMIGDPNDYMLKGILLPQGEAWGINHELEGLRRGWITRKTA